jgi:hypothetical protein
MDKEGTINPVKIFYSYSHKDEKLREKLETYLAILRYQKLIEEWHDRKIAAGSEWAGDIDKYLNSADVILFLVSADFIASRYCYDIEVTRALERHDAGEARVLPIILRPCNWMDAPFGKLQALPKDAKPVTTWPNRELAFTNIVEGIKKVVRELAEEHGIKDKPQNKTTLSGNKPILIFVYDNLKGWILRNIGNEPAMDIVVARRIPGGLWFNPVRTPGLSKDGEHVLTWLNHTNIHALGATYNDIHGNTYTVICGNDKSRVFEGNQFPSWKEEEIERHWNVR